MKLNFKDNAWKLADKPELRVNKSNVDGWINTVILMVYSEVITEKADDLAKYGLAKPKVTVKIKREGERDIQIEAGDELPSGGAQYVKVSGSDAVYKVSSADLQELDKTELDFIEKNPITVNYDGTKRIQIKWREYNLDLQMVKEGVTSDDHEWKLNGKKTMTHAEVKSLLTEMTLWTAVEPTKPLSEIDTSVPDLSIVLTEKKGDQEKVREYIGMIGAETINIAEKGTKHAYPVLGDPIHSFVVSTNQKVNSQ
jgi:hypothetical protein